MNKILVCILNYYQDEYVINLINDIINKNLSDSFYFSIGNIKPKNSKLHDSLRNLENTINYSYIDINYNCGYAKGNNELLRLAAGKDKFQYILITNPDIKLDNNNLITRMADDLKSGNNYAVVGPKVVDENGRQAGPYLKQNPWGYGFKHLLPFFWIPFWFIREKKINKIDKLTRVWRVIGAFFMIKIDAFKNVGYFDENTFMYWEEDILSYKLEKLKQYVLYDPTIKVTHLHTEKKGKAINQFYIDSMIYYFKLCNYNSISIKFCEKSVKFYNTLVNFIK